MSVGKDFFSKMAQDFSEIQMKMEWPKSKELTESDLLEKTFGLKDAPYWPLWFCKNWMSGKNVVTNLYAKKLLTNQIAGFLNIYWQAGGYAPFN